MYDETLYASDLIGMTSQEVVAYLAEWEDALDLRGRAALASKRWYHPKSEWFCSQPLRNRERLFVTVTYSDGKVCEAEVAIKQGKRRYESINHKGCPLDC